MKRSWWIAGCLGFLFAAAAVPLRVTAEGSVPATKAQATLGTRSACRAFSGLPIGWRKDDRAGMVRVRGGEVELGSTRGYPEERRHQKLHVPAFWIDRTEVTNAQFADFVRETGYVTEAERRGGSVLFRAPATAQQDTALNSWWHYVTGVNWHHPDDPKSDLLGRANQPVVHVTYADASAYARWLGRSLPTEAQWEYAAKADRTGEALDRAPRDATGLIAANFWQGNFPFVDTKEDGYGGPAPVGCFAANPFGLHDMIGNVWEWTQDAYREASASIGHGDASRARYPSPSHRDRVKAQVIKGGSFLCSADFCVRYRAAARYPQEHDLPTAHVGFRTVAADDPKFSAPQAPARTPRKERNPENGLRG